MTATANWSDENLASLLAAAEADINARRGPVAASVTEVHDGRLPLFTLNRAASAITTVIEYDGGVATALAANDYRLHPNGLTLIREPYGTHQQRSWSERVDVTFAPIDDLAARKRVQLALMKLDIEYSGLAARSTTSESKAMLASYQIERAGILASWALTGERYY